MQAATVYPIKVVSRSVVKKRSRRLAWFAMGVAFSLGCTSALTPSFKPSNWASAIKTAPVVTAANAPVTPAAPEIAAATPAPADMDTAQNDAAEEPAKEVVLSENEPEKTPVAEKTSYPLALELKVENGDTLMNLLTDAGVPGTEAYNVVNAIGQVYDPKKLDIGQNISVKLDKNPDNSQAPVIASLILPVSATANVEVTRNKNADDDDQFNVKKVELPLERKLARAGGQIDSSLYETGVSTGLPPSLINEIISAYSYDVDFQRDIQPGDSMDVLFEQMQTKSGAVARTGNVIFAELDLGDRTLKIYRYIDKDGNADYYDERGESIRKALLRTPVNGARITSGYGMRMHPLLGYSKMHRGIDFGAPTGTPIYAAGDGTIQFIGRKGGYGNFVAIKHNASYATGYGHISRFATGMTPGRKVKQGQIIAYVGSTGMSTGPHLHYEIMVNNEQVNPSNVKFKTGNVLRGKELLAFRQQKGKIEAKLASLQRGHSELAMVKTDKSSLDN